MKTYNLTPKSNDPVKSIRFTGSFGQPTGFGSILDISIRRSGECSVTIENKEQHMWTAMLTQEQRLVLADFLHSYKAITFEEY